MDGDRGQKNRGGKSLIKKTKQEKTHKNKMSHFLQPWVWMCTLTGVSRVSQWLNLDIKTWFQGEIN